MWREIINIWKSNSLLDQAWTESFDMLEIDRRMFQEAVRVLRHSDELDLNEDIRKLDRRVNKYEREVRRKVMTHCAVCGASELPSALTLVSIVIDIERVGDYCKNITTLASYHPRRLAVHAFEPKLQEVEKEVAERFDATIEALREHDADKARALMRAYREETSQVCDDILEQILRGTVGDLSPADASTLALYVRYLKRISSHLNNMATSVVNPFDRIGYKEKKPKTA